MSYSSGRQFLQLPGPTNVPERVLRAMSRPTIDHRGPDFARLGLEVLEGLKEVFQTKGNVVIFPSSGTGAWEAALRSIGKFKTMNIYRNGDGSINGVVVGSMDGNAMGYFASLQFPALSQRVELPEGALWVDALDYAAFDFAAPRPADLVRGFCVRFKICHLRTVVRAVESIPSLARTPRTPPARRVP